MQVAARLGAEAVLTGAVGPKAFATLQAGGIAIYTGLSGTVREGGGTSEGRGPVPGRQAGRPRTCRLAVDSLGRATTLPAPCQAGTTREPAVKRTDLDF